MQALLEALGSLRELGSEGLASGLALVVGRVVADGGVHDVDAGLVASAFQLSIHSPSAHE